MPFGCPMGTHFRHALVVTVLAVKTGDVVIKVIASSEGSRRCVSEGESH